jgi:hypothetical protein
MLPHVDFLLNQEKDDNEQHACHRLLCIETKTKKNDKHVIHHHHFLLQNKRLQKK